MIRWVLFATGVAVGYLLNKREEIQVGLEWLADQLDPEDENELPEEEIIIVTDGEAEEAVPDMKGAAKVADDLKKISGIGPKTEAVLHKAGISTYAQLAKADVAHLRQLLDDAGMRVVNPDGWPAQASEFIS